MSLSAPSPHYDHARASAPPERYAAIDALRGLAALWVLVYHYTVRYHELYVHTSEPALSVPAGHRGVDLFFIISGFVIPLSIQRRLRASGRIDLKRRHHRALLDFVVARFARLYPVYWVAAAITFFVMRFAELPGRQVGPIDAIANLTMLQELLGFAHIDGVYWSLQVEWLFYAAAAMIVALAPPRRFSILLATLVVLSLAAKMLGPFPGGPRFQHMHLFLLGALILDLRCGRPTRMTAVLLAIALLDARLGHSWRHFAVTVLLTAAVAAATTAPRVPIPRILVFLGTISYALYLIHQNIGYVVIAALERTGLGPTVAILLATALAVALASGLTYLVEKPAGRTIRRWWRSRADRGTRPGPAAALAIAGEGASRAPERQHPVDSVQVDVPA